jgi:hypothetical protein
MQWQGLRVGVGVGGWVCVGGGGEAGGVCGVDGCTYRGGVLVSVVRGRCVLGQVAGISTPGPQLLGWGSDSYHCHGPCCPLLQCALEAGVDSVPTVSWQAIH